MDAFSSRKTASGLFFSIKGSDLVLRDSSTHSRGGRITPMCSRVGCSSRMSSIQDNRAGPGKATTMRNGKESTGSSSGTPASAGPRKSLELRKHRNVEEEKESLGRFVRKNNNVSRESTWTEARSSASAACSRHGKEVIRKVESSSSLASKHGSRSGASSSNYNLKKLKCSVMNDVDPSPSTSSSGSCSSLLPSSSELIPCRSGRKRTGKVESSFPTRGKNNDSHHGICISDPPRGRNFSISRNDGVTSDTRWSSTARRLNEEGNRRRLLQTESSRLHTNSPITEYQCPFRTTNLTVRRGDNSANRPGGSSTSREDSRTHNSDNIAEVLLALERIGEDPDLTYEQLLVLETNIFLRGLAFQDQHRNMRLDIDNMSYEELLELEERMGSVSTPLSEEALAKSLRKSIYESEMMDAGEDGDDVKCSVCQEEYEEGNEVGRLVCNHTFHAECIQRWLQLKNWCPICKASAAPSSQLPS